jgi:hypothetical protein
MIIPNFRISPYKLRGYTQGLAEGRLEVRRDSIRMIAGKLYGSVPESLEAWLLECSDLDELGERLDELIKAALHSCAKAER